jgi:hypothetical protein
VLSDADNGAEAPHGRFNSTGFYKRRQRFSLSLLLFVVFIGLPIVAVPALRNRLSARVMALKAAMAGNKQPVLVAVGANKEPIPAEFQKPEPIIPKPMVLPSPERILTMDAPISKPGGSVKVTIVPKSAGVKAPGVESAPTTASEEAASPSGEPEVTYQRGAAEQAAYDLLLQLNPVIAQIVQGKDPALKFKSWDAANRGADTYWVRLIFQSDGNADAEYIWTVKVQDKKTSPLNFNARSLN